MTAFYLYFSSDGAPFDGPHMSRLLTESGFLSTVSSFQIFLAYLFAFFLSCLYFSACLALLLSAFVLSGFSHGAADGRC